VVLEQDHDRSKDPDERVAERATPTPCVTRAARSDAAVALPAAVDVPLFAAGLCQLLGLLGTVAGFYAIEMAQSAFHRGAVVEAPGKQAGIAGRAREHRQDEGHHDKARTMQPVAVRERGSRDQRRDDRLENHPPEKERPSPETAAMHRQGQHGAVRLAVAVAVRDTVDRVFVRRLWPRC
jgi:hypothetical protein